MLPNIITLASVLLLSTAAFGADVRPAGYFEVAAQPKGIDVSSHQGNVNWDTVAHSGVAFAYIKATEGTGKHDGTLIVQNADVPLQATRAHPSLPSTLVPPKLASSVAATTSPSPISPLVPPKPTTSPPMVAVGPVMAEPSQVPLTSNVRIVIFCDLLDPP